jgi:hypothetical protein
MHQFARVAKAYQTLRRGGKISPLDRELFVALLDQNYTFFEMLKRVCKEKRYHSYRMVLERMLNNEPLECFEDELADELLGTLAQIDKMIAFDAAYQQMDAKMSFYDMATVTAPADRSGWRSITKVIR